MGAFLKTVMGLGVSLSLTLLAQLVSISLIISMEQLQQGQHMDHHPPGFTHLIGLKDHRTEETGFLPSDQNGPDPPTRWELNQRRLL